MQKKRKTHTLRTSIIRVLIGTSILQLCIMAGVLFLSGTTEQLDANAEQSLKDTVLTQGEKLEERMTACSDLSIILNRVNEISEMYCRENETDMDTVMADSTLEVQLIQRYTSSILRLLRSSGTTGSFIILNGQENREEKNGIYFRDLDPQVISKDDSDILVEIGPGDYLVDAGYTLDSNWHARLNVNGESDFYKKPYEAAIAYGDTIDAHNLGYWSPTFCLVPSDIQIVTYSVPLITEAGQVYGVMGIELSEDYLLRMINSREIVVDGNAGMVLATNEPAKESELYHAQITSGSQYQSMLLENPTFFAKQNPHSDKNSLFSVTIGDNDANNGSKYSLHLYNSNTPFEGEEWALWGIAHRRTLKSASRDLVLQLLIAAMISLGASILTAFMFAIKTTRPIYKLMQGISDMNGYNAHLPKTQIREFDELCTEIETRNRAVWESANKTANIIRMTGLSLGVFEYDEFSERNFCTDKILELFEIDVTQTSWENNYVDLKEMQIQMEKIKGKIRLEQEEKEIYRFEGIDHTEKWIRIRTVGTPKHYLCIVMDVTDEMNEKQKIKHERDYDVLTDLYNRRAFARKVKKILQEKPTTKGVMSIWDLDNLKYMNDTYGHDMGDRYIALLAKVFKRVQRSNVVMSRMSGDEFMMFIYDENPARICEIMRDVHRAFLAEKICLPDGTKISVSASAGMAIYPLDGTTYGDLMRYSDFAMYEVKNNEKGAIKLFNREHFVRDYILVQGVGELTRILQEEKVHYVFQPIVDVRTRQVFAYEALLRPESELLKGPDELIRLAESQSKLRQIEVITWMHAVREYAEQMEQNPYGERVKLFLNSIPGQSLQEEEWKYLEERYGFLLPQIVMEVTEIAKSDTLQEQKKYEWCKNHNILIALDDYGSGYSNNDVLVSTELDFVKLDMSIIHDIHMLPARQRLVKGIIDYCHENHIKVIAEGIELKKEMEEVIRLGTDYVQGYYLARPQENIQDMNDKIADLFTAAFSVCGTSDDQKNKVDQNDRDHDHNADD